MHRTGCMCICATHQIPAASREIIAEYVARAHRSRATDFKEHELCSGRRGGGGRLRRGGGGGGGRGEQREARFSSGGGRRRQSQVAGLRGHQRQGPSVPALLHQVAHSGGARRLTATRRTRTLHIARLTHATRSHLPLPLCTRVLVLHFCCLTPTRFCSLSVLSSVSPVASSPLCVGPFLFSSSSSSLRFSSLLLVRVRIVLVVVQ